MTTVRTTPRHRRVVARARVKSAARGLNQAVVDAGSTMVRSHPWAATAAGFCIGLAVPMLFARRSSAAAIAEDAFEEAESGLRGVWHHARSAALEAFACALATSVDRLLQRATGEAKHVCED